MKTSLALAGLVAIVKAINFTSPALNAQWDLSKSNVISWSHVDTDPGSFSLVLVNHDTTLPVTLQTIDNSVTTSAGSYTVNNLVATPGNQYTVKAISTSVNDNGGQLAESQTFSIIKSGGTATTWGSTSTTSAASYGSSSSASGTGSSSGSRASGTGSSPSPGVSGTGSGSSSGVSGTGTGSSSSSSSTRMMLGQTFAMVAGPLAAFLAMLL